MATFANISRASKNIAERILSHPVARTLLPYLQRELDPVGDQDMYYDQPARLYLAEWIRELQKADLAASRTGDAQPTPGLEGVGSSTDDSSEEEEDSISESSWIAIRQSTDLPRVHIAKQHVEGVVVESDACVVEGMERAINSPLLDIQNIVKQRRATTVLNDVIDTNTSLGTFEILSTDTTPPPPQPKREAPVTRSEWNDFSNGNISSSAIRRRIFSGGCVQEIRSDAWKFIFGLFAWDSTNEERERIMESRTDEYFSLKRRWIACLLQEQEEDPIKRDLDGKQTIKESFTRIEKDVIRTDRSHPLFNETIVKLPHPTDYSSYSPIVRLRDILMTYASISGDGYVQGMSDLCSPFLQVLDHEVEAYYCFLGLMKSMKDNFRHDGAGMRMQLELAESLVSVADAPLYSHLSQCDSINMFFVFRSLLIAFKREFDFNQLLTLWEAIWCNPYSKQFNIFVAFAVLEANRDSIIRYLLSFDEILKFVNSLAGKIDLDQTLETAELYCILLQQRAGSKMNISSEEDQYGNLFDLSELLKQLKSM
ncbi:hypothetical protein SmJEL517_g02487 [Synchytrium microbalum]|uniref:Rab-GAP TBC domain-containing protein n=1 Tax=Synchytrium microbalum TaxID=1806994 RepID=A0A507C7F3_9FUNG|nr:uncharacterized protein SmJEL517_g02487 [Synchytrium microbalum]TPX35069.1 hypothetical protein SmJEL517_g02487 [Synchytrium microbalum]